MQNPIWNVTLMRMSPAIELYSNPLPLSAVGTGMARHSRYNGVMMTWGGTRLLAVNRISIAMLTLLLVRDTT
jgi:hypothetical protein